MVAVVLRFIVRLHLENVDLEGLFVLAHVGEDDGARFIEVGICRWMKSAEGIGTKKAVTARLTIRG